MAAAVGSGDTEAALIARHEGQFDLGAATVAQKRNMGPRSTCPHLVVVSRMQAAGRLACLREEAARVNTANDVLVRSFRTSCVT